MIPSCTTASESRSNVLHDEGCGAFPKSCLLGIEGLNGKAARS